MTLEQERAWRANKILPVRNRSAERVIKVPYEESECKNTSADTKRAGNDGLRALRQALHNLGLAEEVDGSYSCAEHQCREYDLVVDRIAVHAAADASTNLGLKSRSSDMFGSVRYWRWNGRAKAGTVSGALENY